MDAPEQPPTKDRRSAPRFKVNFHARWEGEWAVRAGTITDLSMAGCFMLTDDLVKPGETVRIEMGLPRQGHITLMGRVVYHMEEIGFAVRFAPFEDGDSRRRLAWLLRAIAHAESKKSKD